MISKSVAAVVATAAVTGLAVAACSSSSSTSGTEHFGSVQHGAAAMATTIPLTYTGPVNTTGSFNISGPAPTPGQEKAFPTKAGTLELKVTKVPVNPQGTTTYNSTTCAGVSKTVVDYSVAGSKSTGTFKDASGSGVVTVIFSGTAPRLSNGKCNESSSAEPITSTAYSSFVGVGPLTVG